MQPRCLPWAISDQCPPSPAPLPVPRYGTMQLRISSPRSNSGRVLSLTDYKRYQPRNEMYADTVRTLDPPPRARRVQRAYWSLHSIDLVAAVDSVTRNRSDGVFCFAEYPAWAISEDRDHAEPCLRLDRVRSPVPHQRQH